MSIFQNNNPNKPVRWGLWTYKIGDPVLFNESERFAPILYNNLKGKIINIELNSDKDEIWFTIEVDKPIMEMDLEGVDLQLVESRNDGKSVIRFNVKDKNELVFKRLSDFSDSVCSINS